MTHYTTNDTAFLSTTTPFHSCATDLAFPVFHCASHPQMCNVDTVRSTEVGLIESRIAEELTAAAYDDEQLDDAAEDDVKEHACSAHAHCQHNTGKRLKAANKKRRRSAAEAAAGRRGKQ